MRSDPLRTAVPSFALSPGLGLAAAATLALVAVSCASGPSCPTGRTAVDHKCIDQKIVDFVQCVDGSGGRVSVSNDQQSLSADVRLVSISAGSTAEFQQQLTTNILPKSDANAQRIIDSCNRYVFGGPTPGPGGPPDEVTRIGLMTAARERAPGMAKLYEWVGYLPPGGVQTVPLVVRAGQCVGAVGFSPPGNVFALDLQAVYSSTLPGVAGLLSGYAPIERGELKTSTSDNTPVLRGENGRWFCPPHGAEGQLRVYARAGAGVAGVQVLGARAADL